MRKLFKIGTDRHSAGNVIFSWHPDGNFIASAGSNSIVQITDRSGAIVDEIPMSNPGQILSLQWDKDGDLLAILQEGNSFIPLWSLSSRRVVPLELGQDNPTFISWSKTGPQLAIGNAKGNLIIYNKQQKKKIPILAKHAKKIVSGTWSNGGNKLALGSTDNTITVSNETGETLIHSELKSEPKELSFCNRAASMSRQNNQNSNDDTISANLGGRSILLLNFMNDKEDPMELTFSSSTPNGPCRYGEILHYEWFNDNMLVIGFSLGWVIVVSTDINEIGEERYATQIHPNKLVTFNYNPTLRRIATAVADGIRIIDTRDFKEIKQDAVTSDSIENGRVTQLQWSPDGQILTVATSSGNLYNFLAKLSNLYTSYKNSICYLSSLRELSVLTTSKRKMRPIEVPLQLEPTVIAVGAFHVAAGMNNKVYFHRINGGGGNDIVNEQEYPGTVKEIQLNKAFAAVLTDNKVTLHPIEQSNTSNQHTRTFPTRDEGAFAKVTSIGLTDDFLYYGTEAGAVEVYYISEGVLLPGAELRLNSPIKKLYPNSSGTRVAVVDRENQIYLYNPITGGGHNESIVKFEAAPSSFTNVIWDASEKNVVMINDGRYIHTYVYVVSSMKGPLLSKLGPVEISPEGGIIMKPDKAEIPPGNTVIMSDGGYLTCQTITGGINSYVHPYFDQLTDKAESKSKNNPVLSKAKFCQSLALLRLEDAWHAALDLDRREFWLALSGKAMEMLNVELSIKVYRQLGDAGMVISLQKCLQIEDKDLLAGHIALFFSDYHRAQELFLSSSQPEAALDMLCDLLSWDTALKLADKIAPERVPYISIKYGQQLEFREDPDRALRLFESALYSIDDNGLSLCPDELVPTASAGMARCFLRTGDIRKGMKMAIDLNSNVLYAECGEILEQNKQYSEAASFYVKADKVEKAAEIYIQHILKNEKNRIGEAAALMQKVKSAQLNSAFGKACESMGKHQEAAEAYGRANEICKVVELKIYKLEQVQQAFDLVRETCSSEAALSVANYCREVQDYRGAIEFLLMARQSEDAYKVALTHNLVDIYASFLGENIGTDDASRVAHYYEKAGEFAKAARYYSLCAQYQRSLKLYLQCGDKEINAAIDVVGKSNNDALVHQLIDFLVGERDGIPKDPNYIYRLYMALRKYEDAAKTAQIIARQEQDMGNYTLAHSVVFETINKLESEGQKVPTQLREQFVLLHSWILAKKFVRAKDHAHAARLLLRVAENASKFPQHQAQILQSTVIECQRAGLKLSSYEYACTLIRPEFKSSFESVDLRRKIEKIVRSKSDNQTNVPEDLSPCPISGTPIPRSSLICPSTKDAIPMCIITGYHMVADDWTFCPITGFPALYSQYKKYIETEEQIALQKELDEMIAKSEHEEEKERISASSVSRQKKPRAQANDPILGKPITVDELEKVSLEDVRKYIQKYNNVKEEKKEGANGGNEEEKKDGDSGKIESLSSKDNSPVKQQQAKKASW